MFLFLAMAQKPFKMKLITLAITSVINNWVCTILWNLPKTPLKKKTIHQWWCCCGAFVDTVTVAGLHSLCSDSICSRFYVPITMSQCDLFCRMYHINIENSKHWIISTSSFLFIWNSSQSCQTGWQNFIYLQSCLESTFLLFNK